MAAQVATMMMVILNFKKKKKSIFFLALYCSECETVHLYQFCVLLHHLINDFGTSRAIRDEESFEECTSVIGQFICQNTQH